jgi:putative ABC transport system substrate-binding protein
VIFHLQKTMCRRILLLSLCITLLAFTGQLRAQPNRLFHIGYLTLGSISSSSPRREAFRDGLRNLGYAEGQNILIEYRYADGKTEQLPALASDLVRLRLDVIVAGGTQVNLVVKKTTAAIPIVMANTDDPLGSGLVDSLARPGRNITGLSSMSQELSGKRLELFRETFPSVRRITLLWHTASNSALRETLGAAQTLGLETQAVEVRSPDELDHTFALITKDRNRRDGLFTVTSAFMTTNRKRIVEFAAKSKLPAMYPNEEFVDDGGLMSYATNVTELHRRAATYVDKILKGAKPADLPVEQPTKFEFVINLKTAKQIGLTIPPNVLARADRVIR